MEGEGESEREKERDREREMSRKRRWRAGECLLSISVHGTFGYGASTVNDFGHF